MGLVAVDGVKMGEDGEEVDRMFSLILRDFVG